MVSKKVSNMVGIVFVATVIGMSLMMFYKTVDNRLSMDYDFKNELLTVKVQF